MRFFPTVGVGRARRVFGHYASRGVDLDPVYGAPMGISSPAGTSAVRGMRGPHEAEAAPDAPRRNTREYGRRVRAVQKVILRAVHPCKEDTVDATHERELGMMKPRSITFGVMARAPIAGLCKTRLGRAIGSDAAARLQRAMLLDTLDLLANRTSLGLRLRLVVLAAPENDGPAHLRELAPASWTVIAQQGADLGERLANGFATLAGAGVLVCLLGSDSPTLPPEWLVRLTEAGADEDVAVGPCEDGGYYLIGTRAPEPKLFTGIPWSTAGVMDATRSACVLSSRQLVELPSWYDVDDAAAYERLRQELAAHPERAPLSAQALSELPMLYLVNSRLL